MTQLSSPPFVDVPGISNFRDIGGLGTTNGEHIRRGLVFRSADPCKATEEGLKMMSQDLGTVCLPLTNVIPRKASNESSTGIKEIFDLRSAQEIKRDAPEWAGLEVSSVEVFEPYGIHRDWVPVFAEKDYGPEQIAIRYKEYTRSGTDGFVAAYHDILLSAPSAYGRIFRHLASQDTSPCLVNCTAGKDRTGVVIALLLTFAGVPAEKVAEEYELTDAGLRDQKPIFVERLLKNPALEGNREGVWNMVSSKKENMEAAIQMIQRDFGGAEKYMREKCEMSDAEIEQLRKNLVERAN